MNVNEVLANRAIELLGGTLGSKTPGAPQRRRQHGRSRATTPSRRPCTSPRSLELEERLLPRVEALRDAIEAKADELADVVKIGRTHLQDAVPLTVGQEWSG